MSTDGSLTLTSSGTAGVVAMIAPAQMIHGAVADVGVSTEKWLAARQEAGGFEPTFRDSGRISPW
jgi:hypothetical protein